MIFYIRLGNSERVPTDVRFFYCSDPPSDGLQLGRFRDFAILEVYFEDIAHLKNAKISKNIQLGVRE